MPIYYKFSSRKTRERKPHKKSPENEERKVKNIGKDTYSCHMLLQRNWFVNSHKCNGSILPYNCHHAYKDDRDKNQSFCDKRIELSLLEKKIVINKNILHLSLIFDINNRSVSDIKNHKHMFISLIDISL